MVVAGGWICARAAILVPWTESAAEPGRPPAAGADLPFAAGPPAPGPTPTTERGPSFAATSVIWPASPHRAKDGGSIPALPASGIDLGLLDSVTTFAATFGADTLPAPAPASLPAQAAAPLAVPPFAPDRRPGRWSASGWAFLRRGGEPSLASGGTLGGSQVGARILYRLNRDASRPLSLAARFYSPLESRGAEASLGVEWQPLAGVPLRLLAERRQALDDQGRSAFSLLAHGGVSDRRIAGPLLLDAYAQAGIVGLRSADLFADGSAQIGIPVGREGRLKVGAGLWGAVQPGLSRLDAGPQASYRMRLGGAAVRVAAEWRFRMAGDAAPASGPALTVATEF
jgi:hypothetical protein